MLGESDVQSFDSVLIVHKNKGLYVVPELKHYILVVRLIGPIENLLRNETEYPFLNVPKSKWVYFKR